MHEQPPLMLAMTIITKWLLMSLKGVAVSDQIHNRVHDLIHDCRILTTTLSTYFWMFDKEAMSYTKN